VARPSIALAVYRHGLSSGMAGRPIDTQTCVEPPSTGPSNAARNAESRNATRPPPCQNPQPGDGSDNGSRSDLTAANSTRKS